MKLKIDVDTSEFESKMKRASENVQMGLIRDSENIRDIVDKTTYPNVPVDTGELRKSIKYFSDVKIEGSLYIQEFTYSARNPFTGFNYAEEQHTNTRYFHPNGGHAYYLRDGMLEAKDLVLKEVAKVVRGAFE